MNMSFRNSIQKKIFENNLHNDDMARLIGKNKNYILRYIIDTDKTFQRLGFSKVIYLLEFIQDQHIIIYDLNLDLTNVHI